MNCKTKGIGAFICIAAIFHFCNPFLQWRFFRRAVFLPYCNYAITPFFTCHAFASLPFSRCICIGAFFFCSLSHQRRSREKKKVSLPERRSHSAPPSGRAAKKKPHLQAAEPRETSAPPATSSARNLAATFIVSKRQNRNPTRQGEPARQILASLFRYSPDSLGSFYPFPPTRYCFQCTINVQKRQ